MNQDLIQQYDKTFAERFPVRLKKAQKEVFLDELEQELQTRDYTTERLTLKAFLKNRILITECQKPQVIFLAHIDTPTIAPFWMSPLFKFLGHTRQYEGLVFLLIIIYGPSMLAALLPEWAPALKMLTNILLLIFGLSLISLFIPNPHNREDNSSGVISLLALADWLKDKPDLRPHVQFAFLDNEELGLLGSSGLRKYWQQQGHPYQNAAIICLDCVTRGQIPLVVYHKNDAIAQKVAPHIQAHLPQTQVLNLKHLPLSDNYVFKDLGAIDISFADTSTIPGGYYIPRIHTPQDNDFSAENLMPLLTGLTEFLEHELQSGEAPSQQARETADN
ncbi:MAG: M28 family peptidase [Aquificales bacterium]|nr:M28 family peptidase [Aquificales bacterium]